MRQMACHVEPGRADVTFLYKLVPGVCAKSYGMNVATLAGMPPAVVAAATRVAADFERARGHAAHARHAARTRLFRTLVKEVRPAARIFRYDYDWALLT